MGCFFVKSISIPLFLAQSKKICSFWDFFFFLNWNETKKLIHILRKPKSSDFVCQNRNKSSKRRLYAKMSALCYPPPPKKKKKKKKKTPYSKTGKTFIYPSHGPRLFPATVPLICHTFWCNARTEWGCSFLNSSNGHIEQIKAETQKKRNMVIHS